MATSMFHITGFFPTLTTIRLDKTTHHLQRSKAENVSLASLRLGVVSLFSWLAPLPPGVPPCPKSTQNT